MCQRKRQNAFKVTEMFSDTTVKNCQSCGILSLVFIWKTLPFGPKKAPGVNLALPSRRAEKGQEAAVL